MKEGLHHTKEEGTFYHAHTASKPTPEFVAIINSVGGGTPSKEVPKVAIEGVSYQIGPPQVLGDNHDEPLQEAWNILLTPL